MDTKHEESKDGMISRRDLLKTTGKAAAGAAAATALVHAGGVPRVFASPSRSNVTLSFLTGLAGSDGATMQNIVKEFNKSHPGITVNMQIIGSWTTFYSKLLPALTAGNAPEVFTTHVQEMLYFQDKGLFLQIDDLFGPSIPESDFAPLPMHYVQYQGHVYGMPLDMHGMAWYWNPTLFQKAGLPLKAPTNADELLSMAQKMTLDKNGNNAASSKFDPNHVVQYGVAPSWTQPPTFLETLWSFGGNTLSADGKTALFNTPQMRQAVQFWHDLIFKYHVANKPTNYGANGSWGAYWNKALAMQPDGDWMRTAIAQHKASANASWMPKFGSKQVAWMSGHVIAAPAGLSGDKKTAVYTFMRYLSSKGLQWTEGAGHIPARVSQRKSSAVMALWPQRVYGPELAAIGHIEQPSTVFFDVQDAYGPSIDAAWNGTMSVDAALAQAQQRVTKALQGA